MLTIPPAMCFGKTLMWVKLSNSGDFLKLLVPSHNWKVMSGWTNHSGMVISQKMNENEMEYRGSKSEFQFLQPNEISVKEQRVDGSYFGLYPKLRFTLMGCESSYQIINPSKQFKSFNFNKLFFSTISNNSKLNSFFVSGLVDAEGSFSIIINNDIRYKTGWHVRSLFQIVLHSRDSSVLYQLQEFFDGIGTIKIDKKRNVINYSVASLKDLTNIIIPHFKKYPLLTQKAADFNLFEQTIDLMNKGAHLTIDGLQQIINIKASMNLGLSDKLKSEFNDYIPVQRPVIKTNRNHTRFTLNFRFC
jgi:hypothetical protein